MYNNSPWLLRWQVQYLFHVIIVIAINVGQVALDSTLSWRQHLTVGGGLCQVWRRQCISSGYWLVVEKLLIIDYYIISLSFWNTKILCQHCRNKQLVNKLASRHCSSKFVISANQVHSQHDVCNVDLACFLLFRPGRHQRVSWMRTVRIIDTRVFQQYFQ